MLSTTDHDRNSAGLKYVYPVISRRAGGLSIGINLNPNSACNWRCVYCQVPDLIRGAAPKINMRQLKDELGGFLNRIINGDFYDEFEIPAELRTIKDIAISGNGESTSAKNFDEVINLITQSMEQFGLINKIKLVLITNGSLANQTVVQAGISKMSQINGEVWFKVDSATDSGLKKINHAGISIERVKQNLITVSSLCSTWLQTCLFEFDGGAPSADEQKAYLNFISEIKAAGVNIKGVLLYGLARPSEQEEAERLAALSEQWMNDFSEQIKKTGVDVRLNT